MKKKYILLGLLSVLLVPSIVLAATYSAAITVVESDGNSYTQLPVSFSVDNTYLVDNNFISSSGLNTRVLEEDSELPHMVVSDRTLFSADISAQTQCTFSYAMGESALSGFPVIVGYGGHVTIVDDAALELGDGFTIELRGYVDVSAGSNKNLVYKQNAFIIYIQAAGSIRAAMLTAGDAETKLVTATGISSGVRKVNVVADGVDLKIFVYDASGTLLDDDTVALSGTSVPDNANTWYLMQNNVMSYMEYIKLWK